MYYYYIKGANAHFRVQVEANSNCIRMIITIIDTLHVYMYFL